MHSTSTNLRYLLWRAKVEPRHWSAQLSRWLRCEPGRSERLLAGDDEFLLQHEVRSLARAVERGEAEIQFAMDTDGVDVLLENIRYLFGTLNHGEKQKLADHLGVHPTTLSKWRSNVQTPSKAKLSSLVRYFGLPLTTDLATEPIFLSRSPVSQNARRAWLHRRIDTLDPVVLNDLFPALERLLGDR